MKVETSLRHLPRILFTISLIIGLGLLAGLSPLWAAKQDTGHRHSLIRRPSSELQSPTAHPNLRSPETGSLNKLSPRPSQGPPPRHKMTKKPASLASAHGQTAHPDPTYGSSLIGSYALAEPGRVYIPQTAPDNPRAGGAMTKSLIAVPTLPGAPLSSVPMATLTPSRTTTSVSHSIASPGSTSAPTGTSGSRSMQRLVQDMPNLPNLVAPTLVVSAPPSAPAPVPPPLPRTPPPTSSPPPSSPPPSPTTGSATLTWSSNGEPDLAGYKVYVGTQSGLYAFPGSPFLVGKATSYTIANLPSGQTYVFAISAYDGAGNESSLSAEVSKSIY